VLTTHMPDGRLQSTRAGSRTRMMYGMDWQYLAESNPADR